MSLVAAFAFPATLTNVAGTPPDFFFALSPVVNAEDWAAAPSPEPVVGGAVFAVDLWVGSSFERLCSSFALFLDALSGVVLAFLTMLFAGAVTVVDGFLVLDTVEAAALGEEDVAALLLNFFLSSLLSSIETTVFLRDLSAPVLPDAPDPLSFLAPVAALLEAFDLAGVLRFEADVAPDPDDCFFSACELFNG